jgi:hypothetical protein
MVVEFICRNGSGFRERVVCYYMLFLQVNFIPLPPDLPHRSIDPSGLGLREKSDTGKERHRKIIPV